MKFRFLKDIGPAVIVAAVVLGPGTIMTSSKVGAEYGYLGLPVLIGSCLLMFGMVTAAARVGVLLDGSPCGELKERLGSWAALVVGFFLFGIVAIFQSGNNIAIIASIDSLYDFGQNNTLKIFVLLIINIAVITVLNFSQNLYSKVESLMKLLIFLMVAAFILNFIMVLFNAPEKNSNPVEYNSRNIISLLGLIGTTMSIGGAFYQAYLVKEKGWNKNSLEQGKNDSLIGIIVLCLISSVILMTSYIIYYGQEYEMADIKSLARQLKPVFGEFSVTIFSLGVLASAFSSFLVNGIIGGTVLSDSIGKGHKLSEKWPRGLSSLALALGFIVAVVSLQGKDNVVHLITFAQALTVVGLPAMALALLFLSTRLDENKVRIVPNWMLTLIVIGTVVSFILATRTILAIGDKIL